MIDFLGLEGLVRVAIAQHANQLAHTAPARGIALAVEDEIDGLGRFGTDEGMVEIWSWRSAPDPTTD